MVGRDRVGTCGSIMSYSTTPTAFIPSILIPFPFRGYSFLFRSSGGTSRNMRWIYYFLRDFLWKIPRLLAANWMNYTCITTSPIFGGVVIWYVLLNCEVSKTASRNAVGTDKVVSLKDTATTCLLSQIYSPLLPLSINHFKLIHRWWMHLFHTQYHFVYGL